MPFIPTGYLKHSEAIDRVAEIINRRDPVPPLTQEERNILQGVRDRLKRAMRFQPKPVTPVPKAGDRGLFVARTPSEKYPHRLVEAEPPPPPPKISREEFKGLEAKEARIKEQHYVAEQVLRQLLYAGRVPCKTLNKNGLCIETPKYIWGGEQWDEALKRGWVKFPGALGSSVSGRPIILLDDLEAAFNSDGTVKEEPQPIVSKSTTASETQCRHWLIELMNKNGGPDRSKPKYRSEAKSRFGVGIRAFDRAWQNAIAKTGNSAWSNPGRKS